MINKITAQVLSERLPLVLVELQPNVVSMLEFKWGNHDGIFHSVKATTKEFKKFKDDEIRSYEDRAIKIIDDVLSSIYACPHCHTDLRKCGVLRRIRGWEVVELYISEDGKQARTHHERFESDNDKMGYHCLSCSSNIDSYCPVYDFLRHGIRKDVCINYINRNHKNIPQGNITADTVNINEGLGWVPDIPARRILNDERELREIDRQRQEVERAMREQGII